MVLPNQRPFSLLMQRAAALREEAQLCRRAAACLSLRQERGRMIAIAQDYEARAAALEIEAQVETDGDSSPEHSPLKAPGNDQRRSDH